MKNGLNMRNVIAIAISLAGMTMFSGCEHDPKKVQATEEINETLKNTESYQKTLVGGDEEGASIKIQATHYENSELIRDESTNFNVVYHYKPVIDFIGTDFVVIDVTRNKTGVNPEVQTLKINFTVTE